jgi:hypothetical protein
LRNRKQEGKNLHLRRSIDSDLLSWKVLRRWFPRDDLSFGRVVQLQVEWLKDTKLWLN